MARCLGLLLILISPSQALRPTSLPGEHLRERTWTVFHELWGPEATRFVRSEEAPAEPQALQFPSEGCDALRGCLLGHGWELTGEEVTRGNFGQLYKVRRPGRAETFAVKVLRMENSRLPDYSIEVAAQLLAAEMGYSVPVEDYFVCGKGPSDKRTIAFIVMRFVKGPSLRSWLMTHERLTSAMRSQVEEAIPRLAGAGLWISDATLENVMVDRVDTGDERVVFIDFGQVTGCAEHGDGALAAWLNAAGEVLTESQSEARRNRNTNFNFDDCEALEDFMAELSADVPADPSGGTLFRMG